MIRVTRFKGKKYYINAELIQLVEDTPDTVITLANNTKVVVTESAKDVVKMILNYKRMIHNPQLDLDIGE